MTAFSFVIIVAFVGLAFDVGAAFAKRQEAQNAADAAALAVAAECVESRSARDCPNDQTAASEIALLNERTDNSARIPAGGIDYDTPPPYHVTVTVEAEQRTFFLSILGEAFTSLTVTREATANYGSPVAGTVTIPIAGSECLFPPELAPDEVFPIELWLPQNAQQVNSSSLCSPGFPSGGFAWLGGDDCTAVVRGGAIVTSTGKSAPPDCRDLGKQYFADMAVNRQVALIPMFDTATGEGSNGVYHITRFAVFEVTGFHAQQYFNPSPTAPVDTRCSEPTEWVPTNWNYNNTTCFKGNLLGYTDDPGDFDLGGPITEIVFTKLTG